MERKPHQERALIIIKPDAIQRSLVGEIISRFERIGLKFTAFKFVVPTEKQLLSHYNKDDEWFLKKGQLMVNDLKSHGLPVEKEAIEYGKDIIRLIVQFMQQSPVLVFIVEGNAAVSVALKLTGTTEPVAADIGTIRGDYTLDTYGHSAFEGRAVRNLIHCSESPEEAEREIKVWFDESDIQHYVTAQERIMYDVDFDGKKE
jgi:nucleoside-diphosphate kinase